MKVALLTTDSREHFKDYGNPQPYFGTAPEALLEGFKTMPSEVEVHVISCLQKKPASSPTKLADNMYYHGLHVPNIGWMKTGYLGCIRAVRRKLQEIQPDIVHGQGTERDCAISAIFSGFPNVITIHGNIAELARIQKAAIGSFYWLQGKLETFCLHRTSGVFCNSLYTRGIVAPRTKRCWLVPNAIRPRFFRAPFAVGEECPTTLLNVGVISPRKQQVALLDLAHQMFTEGSVVKWQFVGSCDSTSEYGQHFLASIDRAKFHGYADYCGEVSCDRLITLMDQANALVHFPYEEAFGLVAPEALARGLFVFASDVGGLRDILEHEPAALLIPGRDFHGLKTEISRWLNELKGAYIHRRPSSTTQQYVPAHVAKKHLIIYRSLLT